jgi:hypothetical protein
MITQNILIFTGEQEMLFRKILNFLLIALFSQIFIACSEDKDAAVETASQTSVKTSDFQPLELLWETSGFDNPESVVFDAQNDVLYVSNVNGSAGDKDGNGYIAKVSLAGKILEKEWVTGLNAPKGLAIYNDKLYAADIDTLVEINIPTVTIVNRYQVADAKFLNDVAASSSGQIFVSDMMLNRIHSLHDNNFIIWLESPELENPNGLLVEGDNLIVGSWGVISDGFATETPGHLKTIAIADKSIHSIGGGTPIGNLDGVESAGDGGYYVTDWMAGKLYHVNATGQAIGFLELEQGMADHEVILEKNLILLPMMKSNKLIAYKLK